MFRFRPGNQHITRNFKFQAPKFLFAGEMLGGLAVGATSNQREESVQRFGIYRFFGMCVQPGAVAPQNMQQKQFRGKSVGSDLLLAESQNSRSQRATNIHRYL